ncbi:ImmA/IrrE family metallo-endopeptidase [Paenibacillus sp. FSL L8-0323]|uniref:ImmA/IrrE family metallo-endopeptidase n=1 Tax=Paenibacillus sp. FSL L8-0323 TaxID=2975330 RepID=UPI0030F4C615
MKSYYQTTYLEKWTEDLYTKLGIKTPSQLNIDTIARIINIWIHYKPIMSKGLELEPNMYTMNIDSRLTPERRWLDFLHELCHLLRHAGSQTVMPKQFTQAQENEADQFVLYAAIPFFMVRKMTLPLGRGEAIGYIAREFRVPLYFAKKRYEQIEERIAQGKLLSAFEFGTVSQTQIIQESVGSHFSSDRDEHAPARIQAYYGWEGDFSRPEGLIIEHPLGFDWSGSLDIEVERDYKTCDMPDTSKEVASVLTGDLYVSQNRKGYVTINMSRVAWRHGQNAKRLYLPMEAIDDAINF